jgi:hypothetical protein
MQNADGSKYCRFCGVALMQGSGAPSPQPYSWQSEEFPASDRTQTYQAKRTQTFSPPPPNYQQHSPQMVQPVQPAHLYQQQQPQYYAYGHHYCPNCRTQVIPQLKRKISQAGWIVFAVLLVTVPPLFWIGFCIREDVKICPICGTRVG